VAATTAAAALSTPAVVHVLVRPRRLLEPLHQPGLADVAHAVHDATGRNIVLLALAVAGVAALTLRYRVATETWKIALLVTWAAAPLVAALALSIARPSLDVRYLTVATPALATLAGAGLVALWRREGVVAAAAAMLALAGVRLAQLERSNPEDWPAAVSFVEAERQAKGRVVVAPARALSAFSFYAGRNRGSLTPAGSTVLVVTRADDDVAALATAREAVNAPAYALLASRRFGERLQVQTWARTGLPGH
jgi:hypothetical protein